MPQIFKNGLSLKTQVYGLILILSVISFFVRVVSDVNSTRNYLQTQMASHAQDTATSLGLSISPYIEENTMVIAQTMATAIFDSGYYSQIKFTNTNNNIVFDLQNPKRVESVPTWFVKLFKLNPPTMISEINNGWIMVGTLTVTSHTGQSYLSLWEHTLRSLYNSFILLAISLSIAHLILKALFKPLRAVEKQAILVTRKRFTLNKEIPVARELRTVTQAINNMVINLQNTFDSLTQQTQTLTQEVYLDLLTGLGNRKSFENHFNSVVKSINDDSPLTAMMITLPSLNSINQKTSYQDGDQYVLEASKIISEIIKDLANAKLFRLNGGTFVLLAPYDADFLNRSFSDLKNKFSQVENSLHVNGFANISFVSVHTNDNVAKILSLLDTSSTIGEHQASQDTVNDALYSVNQWRELIKSILSTGEVSFSLQPVKKSNSVCKQCYFEVFAYFLHNDKKVNNSHLFAMAEKLNLTEELDKKIIRSFIDIKKLYPNDKFALNLSKASLYSINFILWLKLYANTQPSIKTNLLFELNETSLLSDVQTASTHIDEIKELGISMCIEHFGTSLTSFRYLKGLDIEYIKIDGSYIQDLRTNQQSQFFIQTVNNICHGFGIKVLACLVEDPDDLKLLENLGCDGVQGNYILPPSKIIKSNQIGSNKEFTFCPNAIKFTN